LSNKTYTVLIENCRLKHGVEFDTAKIWSRGSCRSRKCQNSSPMKKSATPSSSSRCIISICGSGELKPLATQKKRRAKKNRSRDHVMKAGFQSPRAIHGKFGKSNSKKLHCASGVFLLG
jgi:hypothetical protein